MMDFALLEQLNNSDRLKNLEILLNTVTFPTPKPLYTNIHTHTTYSFSPYSPTAAVFAAKLEGLSTVGIVDHDSMGGALELLEAGKIANIPTTFGMEVRVTMANTPLENLRTNNQEALGNSYMTIHHVPAQYATQVNDWFAPYRNHRLERTRSMIPNINKLFPDLNLDLDKDVLPLTQFANGGTITERHLMYGLAKKIIALAGKGQAIADYFDCRHIPYSSNQLDMILEVDSPIYDYDVMDILKGSVISKIFIAPTVECPPLAPVADLCQQVGAMLCYPYFGSNSKKEFEDNHLLEIFTYYKENGVTGVTYTPPRNSHEQLAKVRQMAEQLDLFLCSGEDINAPRQSFVTSTMDDPRYHHLAAAAMQLL